LKEARMVSSLADRWWTFVVRGIAAILFGLLAFLWPGITLTALVLVFGAYALVDGVLSIVAAVSNERGRGRWWALLLQGVLGILAGGVALVIPGLAALALLFVIAARALVTGAFEVAAAIRLRHYIEKEWLLALSGVLSIVFGILLMVFPGAGALALVLWISAYMFVAGFVLVGLGFKLRTWGRRPDAAALNVA
jgi:uncharacterized membrane protein HdeD (DUF308 family)